MPTHNLPQAAFALPDVSRAVRLHILRARVEGRQLVTAASPVARIGLLNMTLGLTDMVMVGRFEPQGLAAIVVVGDLHSIVFSFTAGFAGLVAPYVAGAIGARVAWQVCTIVLRVVVPVAAMPTPRASCMRGDRRGSVGRADAIVSQEGRTHTSPTQERLK